MGRILWETSCVDRGKEGKGLRGFINKLSDDNDRDSGLDKDVVKYPTRVIS